jgi:hypothetical protein
MTVKSCAVVDVDTLCLSLELSPQWTIAEDVKAPIVFRPRGSHERRALEKQIDSFDGDQAA